MCQPCAVLPGQAFTAVLKGVGSPFFSHANVRLVFFAWIKVATCHLATNGKPAHSARVCFSLTRLGCSHPIRCQPSMLIGIGTVRILSRLTNAPCMVVLP